MGSLKSCHLDVDHDFRTFRLIRLSDFYARSLYIVLETKVVNLLGANGGCSTDWVYVYLWYNPCYHNQILAFQTNMM